MKNYTEQDLELNKTYEIDDKYFFAIKAIKITSSSVIYILANEKMEWSNQTFRLSINNFKKKVLILGNIKLN
jgi:hypothetical protein